MKRLYLLLLLAMGITNGYAEHQTNCCDPYPKVELALTYSSKYVWRGLNLVNDSVLQPEMTASRNGFLIEVWGNMDATNIDGHSWDFTELKTIIEYENHYSLLSFDMEYAVGTIHYIFPTSDEPSTWEIFAGVKLDFMFSPALIVYYDIDEVNGWYAAFGVDHEWEHLFCLCEGIETGVEVGASIGWGSSRYNRHYFHTNCNAYLDALFTIALPTSYQCWEATPFFSYSTLVNKHIRKGASHGDNIWGGLRIARDF